MGDESGEREQGWSLLMRLKLEKEGAGRRVMGSKRLIKKGSCARDSEMGSF